MSTGAPSAMDTLAVIPARGGSKRIPRKNIKLFRGRPLLDRTIELLAHSGLFTRILVSTDDDEIAAVAERAGAEVPFRRAPELSGDSVATAPVIAHAVSAASRTGFEPTLVCCVYPAAVLARVEDLRAALDEIRAGRYDYVFTAALYPASIHRALRRQADGGVAMYWPQFERTPSQALEPAYHDAGLFYWGARSAWLEQRPIFGPRSRMLLIPHYRVQDIDTPEDWRRAEMIHELLERERTSGSTGDGGAGTA